MSLLDIVADKYETPGRGALSTLSAPGPLRAAKAAKAPRPKRSESREAVVIDWSASPLVQSVDKRSKELLKSPGELRQAAEGDWDEVSNDPAQLVAFADSLAIVQIRESGGVPDHYKFVTNCRKCGDVPVYEGLPRAIEQCPWCMNGLTAPSIPGVKE
jgi:hypothetical protein